MTMCEVVTYTKGLCNNRAQVWLESPAGGYRPDWLDTLPDAPTNRRAVCAMHRAAAERAGLAFVATRVTEGPDQA